MKLIGCSKLGNPDFKIKYAKLSDLLKKDLGEPLHCLIVPGKLHFIEEDMLKLFS
jgi:diphthine synthase